MRHRTLALLVAASALALPPITHAKLFATVDQALRQTFPNCSVERRTHYLDAGQKRRIEQLGGTPPRSGIAHPYVAICGGKLAGTAYFDVHRVRTLPETLMVVVNTEGAVRRVEVLSFKEPQEYLPRAPWYRQFDNRPLAPGLALGQEIDGVSGATLTARATTTAVRRVLALHQVLTAGGAAP